MEIREEWEREMEQAQKVFWQRKKGGKFTQIETSFFLYSMLEVPVTFSNPADSLGCDKWKECHPVDT